MHNSTCHGASHDTKTIHSMCLHGRTMSHAQPVEGKMSYEEGARRWAACWYAAEYVAQQAASFVRRLRVMDGDPVASYQTSTEMVEVTASYGTESWSTGGTVAATVATPVLQLPSRGTAVPGGTYRIPEGMIGNSSAACAYVVEEIMGPWWSRLQSWEQEAATMEGEVLRGFMESRDADLAAFVEEMEATHLLDMEALELYRQLEDGLVHPRNSGWSGLQRARCAEGISTLRDRLDWEMDRWTELKKQVQEVLDQIEAVRAEPAFEYLVRPHWVLEQRDRLLELLQGEPGWKASEEITLLEPDLKRVIESDMPTARARLARQQEADERAAAVAAAFAERTAAPAAAARHMVLEGTIEAVVAERFGLTIPASMGGVLGGVASVENGTILPGEKSLAVLKVGAQPRRRHAYHEVLVAGVRQLAADGNINQGFETRLYRVDRPDWCVAWYETRDGQPMYWSVANAAGKHTLSPDGYIRSEEWLGAERTTADIQLFTELFEISVSTDGSVAATCGGQDFDPWPAMRSEDDGGFNNPFANAFKKRKK